MRTVWCLFSKYEELLGLFSSEKKAENYLYELGDDPDYFLIEEWLVY